MVQNKEIIYAILFFLFISNVLVWSNLLKFFKTSLLEVIFFDIGQGDAIFIKTPEGHQILIDGGPSGKIMEKIAKEMPFWDKNLDLIILTHPERDHLIGLLDVLKKYRVENILWTGIERDTPEYREWKNLIENEKTKIKIAKFDQKISCQNCHWKIEILYPFQSLEGEKINDVNDTSVVSRLVFGDSIFLFSGDISNHIEESLLFLEQKLKANVLKIAHHGSKNSSSEEFLQKVNPQIAVISVGKENKFRHPHEEVLEVLKKYGIRVFRTDENGDIKIISDGRYFKVKNKKL